MKIESRGKYPGVKLHLEPEECEVLIGIAKKDWSPENILKVAIPLKLAKEMGKHIKELLDKEPDLLKERTPEQIAAILAKDHEKTGMALNALKNGKDWKKIDPDKLKKALAHHVPKA